MKSDKAVKKEFKKKASENPDEYYATSVLKGERFMRKQCACKTWFWTVIEEQVTCGDAECSGGFRLFDNNPCKRQLDYVGVWKEFSKMFEKKGYVTTPRYPVVARWNPTMDFTIASIAAFQPYVVSGEVAAPAKMLTIPQFCLRFGDVDNVGVTMSHLTGFVMIGQKMFLPPEEWDQEKAFQDIYDWLTLGLGLPKEEITFHEDAWAGGGNYGPCMEFFSRGIELGNQVYMLYEQHPEGDRELGLKVLDMGMGMERNAWFSQGEGSIYDATFPEVMKKLYETIGVKYDKEFLHRYIPHAAYLNIDEVEDIDKAWEHVGKNMGLPVAEVKQKIEQITAVSAIAEHSRSLLVALADGALPSNTGGGYNLRVIYRRSQGFIDKYGWDVDIAQVCKWHAEYLQEMYPELLESIDDVTRILSVEKRKYTENKKKSKQIVLTTLKKNKEISTEQLIELYDSSGVDPEEFKRVAKEQGITIVIPDNFYQLVAERHEEQEQKTATVKKTYFPLEGVPKTKILYYGVHDAVVFEGKVIKVFDNKVVLDQTAFYPTSGGQEHDIGTLNGEEVIDVIKQDGIVVHVVESTSLKEGDVASGQINLERRLQLAKHHTTTHIINGAARKVLGNHVWQAGAAKTTEKARIDITHYDSLTNEELQAIEDEANRIVDEGIDISKQLVKKNVAEEKFGFRLYQGGAVPGAEIRVVDIPGFDVEACGGTHLENTAQAGKIKILKSTKVQDGIIRIEFVSGPAAERIIAAETAVIENLIAELECEEEQIPGRCAELFAMWKKAKKGKLEKLEFSSLEKTPGDILGKAARELKTQPEHVLKTVRRFKDDIRKKLEK